MTPTDLQRRARKRFAAIARRRRDPRYRRVLGRYIAAGLLTSNEGIESHREPIELCEALWAGEVEPRIIELLPALVIKKPSFFVDVDDLPDDLREVIDALRHHRTPPSFRGIPGEAILRWLPSIGHKGKLPSQLKTFRMQAGDIELLSRLAEQLALSQTAVVRRGLRALAAQVLRK